MTDAELLACLNAITDPEFGKPLGELGLVKSASVAVGHALTLDGGVLAPAAIHAVWAQPPMWGALGGLLVTAPLQLYLIDVCLASGSVTYAVPLYQALEKVKGVPIDPAAHLRHDVGQGDTSRLVLFD